MGRLDPEKLTVIFLSGVTPEAPVLSRCYTLTHSDITGHLFLSVGQCYDNSRTCGLYARLMRDEVRAGIVRDGDALALRVYCHVSGGFVFGGARLRYHIFRAELPLALEAIRYGDGAFFGQNPELDEVPLYIHFQSTDTRFHRIEKWGNMGDYRR
jgi:hypothetical protein